MVDFIINSKNGKVLVEKRKQETNKSEEYSVLLFRVWVWARSL